MVGIFAILILPTILHSRVTLAASEWLIDHSVKSKNFYAGFHLNLDKTHD